jgi:hypothetical protein
MHPTVLLCAVGQQTLVYMWTTKHARSICVSAKRALQIRLLFSGSRSSVCVHTKKTHHDEHALQQYRLYMLTICKGACMRIRNSIHLLTSLSMFREKLKKGSCCSYISMSVKEYIWIKVCEPRVPAKIVALDCCTAYGIYYFEEPTVICWSAPSCIFTRASLRF